jgi:hypothetical protein
VPNVTDIDTKKTRIARLLSEATSVAAAEELQPQKTLWTFLAIALIGTMLPVQALAASFSLASVGICLIYLTLFWKKQARFSKRASTILVALVLTSVMSGCGPALFSENIPDLFGIERQTDIKTQTITRYGAFGFGLTNATPEQAKREGGITDLLAVKIERGYGLISMARVSVAGK